MASAKQNIQKTVILHSVLYWCEAWPLALREQHWLKVLCCREYLALGRRK